MKNENQKTPETFATGEPGRSGGPMAATVDKVVPPFPCEIECPRCENNFELDLNDAAQVRGVHAAIRRAAEKAALKIGAMVEADDFLHTKTCANEIERHVRRELGL